MRTRSFPGFTRLRSAELRPAFARQTLLISSERASAGKRGFTMIELLLVIGIIAILASIVIVAINPTKQLASARDAKRRHEANQLEKALNQYLIKNGTFPVTIPDGPSAVKPICKEGATDSSCLDFDLLTPDFLVTIPQDASETNSLFSGYQAYLQSGRPQVQSVYLGGGTIITSGLVGYWKFDETSGTSATDSSGSGNAGTHTNSPTISPIIASTLFSNARSLSFDGLNDYVDIGDKELTNGNAISFGGWVRVNNLTSEGILVGKNGYEDSSGGYTIQVNTGGNGAILYDVSGTTMGGIVVPNRLTLNTWTHIFVTYDGANGRLYQDGVPINTTARSGNIPNHTKRLWIGAQDVGVAPRYLNGLLDDVRIYNRTLSPTEVIQIASGNG